MSGQLPIGGATDAVIALTLKAEDQLRGSPFEGRVREIRERLEGPLRVAIAGRVKAGKSTLLNALVGERLAPTDAGECTKIVTWYLHGQGYQVTARLTAGGEQSVSFRRSDSSLEVQLGDLSPRDVTALDVRWPASTLQEVTFIDTPGLASLNDENSRRTREFLEFDAESSPDADAVIYLMRHLHSSDVEFLDAYMDRSVAAASPVNSVAVLSRADEIGAGRLDAMESAQRISDRYRMDPQVTGLAATVVPIAGLLAETGLTLREDEAAVLRQLAATDDVTLESMLLSADQFCDLHASDLTIELRRDLLDRLGMFGVRLAVGEVKKGATTAALLAPILVEASGLGGLRTVISEHFLPRARVLKTRSALSALRSMAQELQAVDARVSSEIDREAERIESSAVEFSRIRAAHLIATGAVQIGDADKFDLERLLLASSAADALGLSSSATSDVVTQAALSAIERWRTRAADPLADPSTIEVCEVAARTAESLYAAAQPTH